MMFWDAYAVTTNTYEIYFLTMFNLVLLKPV